MNYIEVGNTLPVAAWTVKTEELLQLYSTSPVREKFKNRKHQNIIELEAEHTLKYCISTSVKHFLDFVNVWHKFETQQI